MNLKKKTRKRTRKFEIDGVVVTTTTSKIIYGDEENQTFYDEHYFRKQELRELKLLQKQEQKQFQVCNYLFVIYKWVIICCCFFDWWIELALGPRNNFVLVVNVIARYFQEIVSTLIIKCTWNYLKFSNRSIISRPNC